MSSTIWIATAGAHVPPLTGGVVIRSGRAPSVSSSSFDAAAAWLFGAVTTSARQAIAPLSSIVVPAQTAPAATSWCKFRFLTLVVSPGSAAACAPGLMSSAACRYLAAASLRELSSFVQPASLPTPSVADSLDLSAPSRTENLLHRSRAPPDGPGPQSPFDPPPMNAPPFLPRGLAEAFISLGIDVPETSVDFPAVATTSLAHPTNGTPHPQTSARASSRRAPHILY